jgi:hypothetical protein
MFLKVQQQTARILKSLFDTHKECNRALAVNDAVIV